MFRKGVLPSGLVKESQQISQNHRYLDLTDCLMCSTYSTYKGDAKTTPDASEHVSDLSRRGCQHISQNSIRSSSKYLLVFRIRGFCPKSGFHCGDLYQYLYVKAMGPWGPMGPYGHWPQADRRRTDGRRAVGGRLDGHWPRADGLNTGTLSGTITLAVHVKYMKQTTSMIAV